MSTRTTLPEGSASLSTKYLLESDTGSTATPGWVSTGHIANSSPVEQNNNVIELNTILLMSSSNLKY